MPRLPGNRSIREALLRCIRIATLSAMGGAAWVVPLVHPAEAQEHIRKASLHVTDAPRRFPYQSPLKLTIRPTVDGGQYPNLRVRIFAGDLDGLISGKVYHDEVSDCFLYISTVIPIALTGAAVPIVSELDLGWLNASGDHAANATYLVVLEVGDSARRTPASEVLKLRKTAIRDYFQGAYEFAVVAPDVAARNVNSVALQRVREEVIMTIDRMKQKAVGSRCFGADEIRAPEEEDSFVSLPCAASLSNGERVVRP